MARKLKDYIVAYSHAEEGYAAWVRVEPKQDGKPTMMERRTDYHDDKLDPVVIPLGRSIVLEAQL